MKEETLPKRASPIEVLKTLLETGNNLAPGGVLLGFLPSGYIKHTLGALELLERSLNEDSERVFRRVHSFVPPQVLTEQFQSAFGEGWAEALNDVGVIAKDEKETTASPALKTLNSCSADALLKAVEISKKRTCVNISHANLFRFPENPPTQKGDQRDHRRARGWRSSTEAETSHLLRIVRESLRIAAERNILVCLLCESDPVGPEDLPEDLQLSPDLAVFNFGSESKAAKPQRIAEIAALVQNGELSCQEAEDQVLSMSASDEESGFHRAIILHASGQLFKAGEILADYSEGLIDQAAPNLLACARIFYDCGRLKQARAFHNAATESGVKECGEMYLALELAEAMDMESESYIREQLLQFFPDDQRARAIKFNEALKIRNFAIAEKWAEAMGDSFLVALSRSLRSFPFDEDSVVKFVSNEDELDTMLIAFAREALALGKRDHFEGFCVRIGSESSRFSDSVDLRLRSIGASDSVEEIAATIGGIMEGVASAPANLLARFQIERFLEDELEDPLVLFCLLAIADDLFEKFFDRFSPGGGELDQVATRPSGLSEEDHLTAAKAIFESVLKAADPEGIVPGKGKIPDDVLSLVNEGSLYGLTQIAHVGSEDPNPDFFQKLLHVIALVAAEAGNPISDILTGQMLAASLARGQMPQDARDFSESMVQLVASVQKEQMPQRTSMAWCSMADVYSRLGDPIGGMKFLIFGLLSFQGEEQYAECAFNKVQLYVRILRDLGLSRHALTILDKTPEIFGSGNAPKHLSDQLETLQISLQIQLFDSNTPVKTVVDILDRIVSLKTETSEGGMAPLLSLQAAVLGILRNLGESVPDELVAEVSEDNPHLPGALRFVLAAAGKGKLTRSEFEIAISGLTQARLAADVGFQLSSIGPVIAAATRSAVDSGDVEYFLHAASVRMQPGVVLGDAHRGGDWCGSQTQAQVWSGEVIASPGVEKEMLIDALRMASSRNPMSVNLASSVKELSVRAVQEAMLDGEQIWVFALLPEGRMAGCCIPSKGTVHLCWFGDEWNFEAFRKWKKMYPQSYSWHSDNDPLIGESPSIDDVQNSISWLKLPHFEQSSPDRISSIFAVDAELFGVPWGFVPAAGGELLCETCSISTVPSLAWLVAGRKTQNGVENVGFRAWFGAPTSPDLEICLVRSKLEPICVNNDVTVVSDDEPIGCAECALAIVVSHGSQGYGGFFKNVSDGRDVFDSKRFSSYFRSSTCVVLFVCHAGRSDPAIGSLDARALVSELMSSGVKAVIAPQWPLNIDIPPHWLPGFLEAIGKGSTIREAKLRGDSRVKEHFASPAAWHSMNLYGDGEITCSVAATQD